MNVNLPGPAIPQWAQSAANSFFGSGTIAGASKAPYDASLGSYLNSTVDQSFDSFVKMDNNPAYDSNPSAGIIESKNPVTATYYQGNAQTGSYTQISQADSTLQEVVQVVRTPQGTHIFEAAKDGSNSPTFLAQVLDSANPEQGYLLSTAADH